MEEAYYLKIIMKDDTIKYMGHSTYLFDEKPSFRSLMELKDAKSKKTKLIKKMKEWAIHNSKEEYKDVEICKATISYEEI